MAGRVPWHNKHIGLAQTLYQPESIRSVTGYGAVPIHSAA